MREAIDSRTTQQHVDPLQNYFLHGFHIGEDISNYRARGCGIRIPEGLKDTQFIRKTTPFHVRNRA